MNPSRSSLLENFRHGPDGLAFALDGREIRLKEDGYAPVVRAIKGLLEEAQAGYEAHQKVNLPSKWAFARLGSWFRNLLPGQGPTPLVGSDLGRAAAADQSSRPAGSPTSAVNAQFYPQSDGNRAAARPAGGQSGSLQAIFADQDGVQVFWGQPGSQLTRMTFPLESAVGLWLGTSYAELAKLGYEVAGLDAISPQKGPTSAQTAHPAPATGAAAGPVPAPVGRSVPAAPVSPIVDPKPVVDAARAVQSTLANTHESTPPAPKSSPTLPPDDPKAAQAERSAASALPATQAEASRTVVMKLHPSGSDLPNRALVSSLAAEDRPEVLVAPERVLRALRAAAEASGSDTDQLTFIRCARGEDGLSIVDVGFGVAQADGREPVRWQDAKEWWNGPGKALASRPVPQVTPPGSKSAEPAIGIPGPSFEPGQSPIRTGFEPNVPG